MTIVHLGNIANNGYNNAKYLNKIESKYQHHVINYDNPHCMSHPEWEEVNTDSLVEEYFPDWSEYRDQHPRPFWYHEKSLVESRYSHHKICGSIIGRLFKAKARAGYRLKELGISKNISQVRMPTSFRANLSVARLLIVYALTNSAYQIFSFLSGIITNTNSFPMTDWIHALVQQNPDLEDDITNYCRKNVPVMLDLANYDLVQGYATDVISAWLFSNGKPFIAYEHGTLRDLPFENNSRGRLLSAAYRHASHVFITNPDVQTSASKLNLRNYSFVPHVVDTDRYTPVFDEKNGDELRIFSPTRQNWDIKGNDKLISAFAQYIGQGRSAKLIISKWGQNVDNSIALIRELGIERYVEFYLPSPKLNLLKQYQRADIVVDQLHHQTFGGISPEAMSCEKPVISNYDSELHNWCYPEHPPICIANTESKVLEWLNILGPDRALRRQRGVMGREWVCRYYSIENVVQAHLDVYSKVLN